jgi:GNAT superfamily N-acetyltransferase
MIRTTPRVSDQQSNLDKIITGWARYGEMKTTYVHYNSRSIADLVEDTVTINNKPVYWITRINVPKTFRGRGIASRILKRMIHDADKHNVVLRLGISPSDGLSFRELKCWYERYGFSEENTVITCNHGGLMTRLPRPI